MRLKSKRVVREFSVLLVLALTLTNSVAQVTPAPAGQVFDAYEPPNPTLVRPSEDPKRTVNGLALTPPMIAIDQDTLGIQGHRVRDDGDLEVWSKQLADGSRAVVLLNRGPQPAQIIAKWPELGYTQKLSAEVRDLWAHKSLGRKVGSFSATVPSHGVVMVRVTP